MENSITLLWRLTNQVVASLFKLLIISVSTDSGIAGIQFRVLLKEHYPLMPVLYHNQYSIIHNNIVF